MTANFITQLHTFQAAQTAGEDITLTTLVTFPKFNCSIAVYDAGNIDGQ